MIIFFRINILYKEVSLYHPFGSDHVTLIVLIFVNYILSRVVSCQSNIVGPEPMLHCYTNIASLVNRRNMRRACCQELPFLAEGLDTGIIGNFCIHLKCQILYNQLQEIYILRPYKLQQEFESRSPT